MLVRLSKKCIFVREQEAYANPMAQEEEGQEKTPSEAGDNYTRTEAFIEKYQRIILGVIVLIVIAVAGYMGYQRFYLEPLNEEAGTEMWKAEYYLGVDSLERAIEGEATGYYGFRQIVESYGATEKGELARYYLAVAYLHEGSFQKAAEHAEDVSMENELVDALAKGVAGEAYVEIGQQEKGLRRFKSAAKRSDNGLTRPLFLKKAGLVLEELGRYQDAVKLYERIRDDHPASAEGRDIEKYIARAESYI